MHQAQSCSSVLNTVGLITMPKTATIYIVFICARTHLLVPLCYFHPIEVNYLLSISVDS